jgi:hypothetical protein
MKREKHHFPKRGWLLDWLELKRVCAWCHARLGGNPFAKKISHGICRECGRKFIEPQDFAT